MITKRKTKKRLASVVGLAFADGHMRACHVTRAKGVNEVVKAASAALTLDLLHPDSELVGREIKNHLEAAGIRERHCVVALPASWVMSQHTLVPELAPEDANSFLQIEAEKGFPCDPSQLQIARSFHRSAGAAYVTQLAVRKDQLEQLAGAVKAAGLVETLKGAGPFTVFAPTDEAFAKLPAGTVESLLKPENKDQLVAVLTYHVVPGKVMAADVVKLTEAPTVQGSKAKVKVVNGAVMIDGAKVVKTDIVTSNGVIHVIDAVILPPAKK